MTELCVRITEFPDPGCPWAFSAEPFRRRIEWLYEGHIEWAPRMVVLADTPADNEAKGLTPDKYSANLKTIARDHRMPIDTSLRPRVPATRAACTAAVAARVHAGERATGTGGARARPRAGQLVGRSALHVPEL